MRVRGIPVERLTAADVMALVADRVQESRSLEFKSELPGGGDADTKEFLADVCALANTAGGVILFGVETGREEGKDNGIADRVCGIFAPNADAIERRWSQVIRDGVSPRLSAVVRVVPADGPVPAVLAIGVPRSVVGPHAVWFKRTGKFYRRTTGEKYQVEVEELRRMFLESAEWAAEAEKYHRQRVGAFSQLELESTLVGGKGRIVLHILPLGRLREHLDLTPHVRELRNHSFWLRSPDLHRFTLDGYLSASHDSGNKRINTHTLWLRFGGVEVFDGTRVIPAATSRLGTDRFAAKQVSEWILKHVPKYVTTLHELLGVDPPFAIFMSIMDTFGLPVIDPRDQYFDAGEPAVFDRRQIDLPAVQVDDPSSDLRQPLVEMLQVLWQAAGFHEIPKQAIPT